MQTVFVPHPAGFFCFMGDCIPEKNAPRGSYCSVLFYLTNLPCSVIILHGLMILNLKFSVYILVEYDLTAGKDCRLPGLRRKQVGIMKEKGGAAGRFSAGMPQKSSCVLSCQRERGVVCRKV